MDKQDITTGARPAPRLPQLHGVIVLNKPKGISSAQCLSVLKRMGQKKIGHAGTLDPMATGVLIALLGQATRLSSHLLHAGGKIYKGTLRLGLETDTWDAEGEITAQKAWEDISADAVEAEIKNWLNLREQEVPSYSAAKHEGKALYKLARKGLPTPVKMKSIQISQAEMLDIDMPFATFRVSCSSGAYVRSLAHSLGKRLGCGAVLWELTREYSCPFGLENACSLADLKDNPRLVVERLLPLASALPSWPCIELDAFEAEAVKNGRPVTRPQGAGAAEMAFLCRNGQEMAIARLDAGFAGQRWIIERGLWN